MHFARSLSAVALGLLLLAPPLAGEAQQPGGTPVVGFLAAGSPSTSGHLTAAFTARLRELGWTEGRNLTIQFRWAEGRSERFAEIATEFVRQNVNVIVTWGTATALAAKQATTVIPIVFTLVSDPVGTGVVASLARPGGNATGVSTLQSDAADKRLEILREVVPTLHRLAIMANVGNPASVRDMHEIHKTARALGLDVLSVDIRRAEDIAPAVEALKGRADALFVLPDALINTQRDRIAVLALAARLPTMHGYQESVAAGGLLSYGPDYPELFRRTADYVNKILRGARPADLPVEQPVKFELVINMKTARALALTIPPSLLLRADQVLE